MIARKVPGVGEGILIDMEGMELEKTPIFVYELMNGDNMDGFLPSKRTSKAFVPPGTITATVEPLTFYEEENQEEFQTTQSSELFSCEKSSLCDAKFIRRHNYEKHNDQNNNFCKIRVVHPTQKDKVLAYNLQDNALPDNKDLLQTKEGSTMLQVLQNKESSFELDETLPMESTKLFDSQQSLIDQYPVGDGLPMVKPHTRHQYDELLFMYELFMEGEVPGGQVVRAADAAIRMQHARNEDGSYRFHYTQWKTESQVKLKQHKTITCVICLKYQYLLQIKSKFAVMSRHLKAGKDIVPKPPKKKATKGKAPKSSGRKPAAKKQKVDQPEEPAEKPNTEREKEVERQFLEEFADFDWSEPSEQARQEQEDEIQLIEAREAGAAVSEFFKEFKKLKSRDPDKPKGENGCPIMVRI